MPHRSARAGQQQPKKHPARVHFEFKGRVISIHMKSWKFMGFMGLFAFLLVWSAATTSYALFRDDVLVGLFNRYTNMQFAYEEKISSMRTRVDQLASRQLLDQEVFEAKLADLISRQSKLETQHSSINSLIEEVQGRKKMSDAGLGGQYLRNDVRGRTIVRLMEDIQGSVNHLEKTQMAALESIEITAENTTQKITTTFQSLGLNIKDWVLDGDKTGSIGGPFIPVPPKRNQDIFQKRVEDARLAMQDALRIRKVVSMVPFRRPIDDKQEVTSSFGVRRDPFTGGMAMHSGMDFRGELGTPIYATAYGQVTEAGWAGGYGQMVEIEHGQGLATRYGHMSSILVKEGQKIVPGQLIGRIGSTGRSTGPHLHYETRIYGTAVDPIRFLKAGQALGL